MDVQEENATLELSNAPNSNNDWLIRPEIDRAQNVRPIGAGPTSVRPETRPWSTVEAANKECLPLVPVQQSQRCTVRCHHLDTQAVNKMQPPFYDGTEGLADFLIQFNMFSELNGWKQHEKFLYLGCSLKGVAREVLGATDENMRETYEGLVRCLNLRFGHENQKEVFKALLINRVQEPNETYQELAFGIRRLVKNAYPKASYVTVDEMAQYHFINAITNVTVREWVYLRSPKGLDEAMHMAIRFQCRFQGREDQANVKSRKCFRSIQSHPEVETLFREHQEMYDSFRNMKVSEQTVKNHAWQTKGLTTVAGFSNPNMKLQCHNCRRFGHIRKECPFPRRRRHKQNQES